MPQAPLPPVPALQPSQAPMASQAPAPVWQAVQSTITDEAWLHWWFAIVFGCFWWFPSHQKKVFKKLILVTSWYQLHTHRWFNFSVFPLRLGVSVPQSPPWRCSSETLRCRSCAWILIFFFGGPELGQWWCWFLANKYGSYLLTFFLLGWCPAMSWHGTFPEEWRFASWLGVQDESDALFSLFQWGGWLAHSHSRSYQKWHSQPCASQRIEDGWQITRRKFQVWPWLWYETLVQWDNVKDCLFCIGNPQIDFPWFRFPSDIVLTGHFDCYSYPQGARRNSLLCHSGCCGRCAQHITSVLSELVRGPSPKKHLLTKQSHHPAMDKGEWCLR